MIAVAFELTARRFHATPWAHHVNEGQVEWPPSPWRILRTLVATAFKIDPRPDMDRVAALLVNKLGAPPEYVLPATSGGHTRHYMPIGTKAKQTAREGTTLIFDPFLAVEAAPVIVIWPDAELTAAEAALLSRLVESIGYLGRAESWAEGRVLTADEVPTRRDARPADQPESAGAVVELPCLVDAEAFASRTAALAKTLTGAPKKRLPATRFDGLLVDTGQVQKDGLSGPPAMATVAYRVREAQRPRAAATSAGPASMTPHVARFAIRCAVPQRIEQVVSMGDQLHRALVSMDADNPLFSGRQPDGGVLAGHRHAYYLPVDEDRDGYVDAILVYFDKGLDARTEATLRRLRALRRRDDEHAVHVALEGIGPADAQPAGRSTGPARRWESATPFLFSRYTKGGQRGLERAIAREFADHRAPAPLRLVRQFDALALEGRAALPWSRFKRDRKGGGNKINDTGHGFEIEFEQPIFGPLALGYGSHYGLGQFRPIDD